MMLRLLITAVTAGVIVGAMGVGPSTGATLNRDCIAGRMNNDGSCYYANCSEAKANGECDIAQGADHYCSEQDRDSDGIACEC